MDESPPPQPSALEAKLSAPKGDPAAMRRFGLVAGGGGILMALAIATLANCEPQTPGPVENPPVTSAPAPSPPTALPPASPDQDTPPPESEPAAQEPVAQPQSASPGPRTGRPARPPAFCPRDEDRPVILVAFERSHPMHEAQRLFAEGRREEARELAARLLAERRDLRGLCLDRFGVGGAEIHLGAPNPTSVTQWVERLSEMDGVERAEAELIAAPY